MRPNLFYPPVMAALIVAVLFQAHYAYAGKPKKMLGKWEASCKTSNGGFTLRFTSQSGDAYEDDMAVELVDRGGWRKAMRIPVAPALYLPRGVVSKLHSGCERVGALPVADGSLLLWLSSSNRPDWDSLTLVLINGAGDKVLDTLANAGKIKDTSGYERLTIKPFGHGFQVRLIRELLTDTESDGPENAIEDWKEVRVTAGKIQTRWAQR